MKKLLTASLVSLALIVPAAADDAFGPLNVPRDQWLPISEVVKKLEAAGYQIHEVEIEAGAYEFEGFDPSGARVEGYAHPATGDVINTRPDR